jgi:hypothetical protein
MAKRKYQSLSEQCYVLLTNELTKSIAKDGSKWIGSLGHLLWTPVLFDLRRSSRESGFGHQTSFPSFKKKCEQHPAVLRIDGLKVGTPRFLMTRAQRGESSPSKLN